MADRRNKIALPALATKYGFRLPPPEDCLIAPNFQFHPQKPVADMEWEESNLSTGAIHTLQPCLMHCICITKGQHAGSWHTVCLVCYLITGLVNG